MSAKDIPSSGSGQAPSLFATGGAKSDTQRRSAGIPKLGFCSVPVHATLPPLRRLPFGNGHCMDQKETKGVVRLEEDRPQFLLRLFLTAVTGFNVVLVSAQALEGSWAWSVTLGVVGVLVPGTVPFLRLIQSYKEGMVPLSWRELCAFGVGAVDAVAIITRWSDGLEVTSWVSVFLISSFLAFLLLAES